MEFLELCLCLLVLLITRILTVNTDRVERIYINNNNKPLKGNNIQLVCEISEFSSRVNIYKTDTSPPSYAGIASLTQCSPSLCLTSSVGRYTFSADNSNIFINISSLNRSEDQKWWSCALLEQRQEIDVTVTTVSKTLKFDNPPSQDQDLAVNYVTLRCSTGCSYPQPSFTWYYKENGGSKEVWSSSASITDKTDGCTDSEKIYTSTLSLAQYTTFPQNLNKIVKFLCGISTFPGMSQPLYSLPSVNVTFAVRVTNITLKDGATTPSEPLHVISGVPKTLTCETSLSRPTATIVWYIDDVENQRSTTSSSFSYTPQNSDHNKQIYCKAFNTQPENQAVLSVKATLYVQVRVTSATIKDGATTLKPSEPIQVVNRVPKTLTCETSVSRPTSTIVWYIDDVEKQRSTTSSSFTFIPQNSDHNTQIYCKAFNTQPENQAVFSVKATLYVQVLATTPTLTNQTTGNLVMFENDTATLECISSATRPVATVTWKKGTTPLTIVHNTNITTGDLLYVRSIVTFIPNRADDAKTVYCQTYIPMQINAPPTTSQKIVVYWPPFTPSIPIAEFPFLESQTGKSLYCSSTAYGNPAANATWKRKSTFGTPDISDSRKLNLPMLTSQHDGLSVSCQLTNSFTQLKGSDIRSKVIEIDVEYTPISQIMVEGNVVQSVTKYEGQNLTAFCNATGNPTPTVKWIDQTPDSKYLQFIDIDRNKHGSYTCRAKAKSLKYHNHNFITEKHMQVNVNYAPKVDVVIDIEEPTENSSLRISCTPSGRPAVYHFTLMVQKFDGTTIPNTHGQVNGILEIPNLQLQDSGTYTCTANNGIPDRNQQLDQTGEKTMRVRVSPKVLLDSFTFAGAPGKSINITVPFYSYPDILHVKFRLPDGSEILNSDKHKVYYESQKVTTKFYGTDVELDGYVAVLHIKDEEVVDFVDYLLELDNNIEPVSQWTLHHVSESIPLVPKFINFTGVDGGVPTFLLSGNFNGGRQQTFAIETTTENSDIWEEKLRFNETDMNYLQQKKDENLLFRFNITGLSANTYIVRVLAGNDLGWINESSAPTTRFTINPTDEPGAEKKFALIGAVAGSSAGVLVAAVVVVIIWKKRTYVIIWKKITYKKGEGTTALKRSPNEVDSSDDEGMTENSAYVSADEVGIAIVGAVPDSMYAQPQKRNKKVVATPGDVYSTVNKSKAEDPRSLYAMPDKKDAKTKKKTDGKGKAGKGPKKGKAKKDDVYENSSELTTVSKTGAYEENPYEDTEETKPKVNRNKDGLIYADLTFNAQPKGQKKLVIHGLDSMTEYVEVDFTKKADPLPDSDDETKDNN